ncbi:hypothetical protein KDA11_03995, partial [Candidatus Saccharibacteria bacterium]|nr:hypothetical protein [Candidatus Saccharibacteria bacterium]
VVFVAVVLVLIGIGFVVSRMGGPGPSPPQPPPQPQPQPQPTPPPLPTPPPNPPVTGAPSNPTLYSGSTYAETSGINFTTCNGSTAPAISSGARIGWMLDLASQNVTSNTDVYLGLTGSLGTFYTPFALTYKLPMKLGINGVAIGSINSDNPNIEAAMASSTAVPQQGVPAPLYMGVCGTLILRNGNAAKSMQLTIPTGFDNTTQYIKIVDGSNGGPVTPQTVSVSAIPVSY